jgi:hypothetical protein
MNRHRTPPARPSLDPAACRAAWRRLAVAGVKVAQRSIETCGREILEPDEFSHALSFDGRVRFPIEGASADNVATSFRLIGRALLTAGTDRRRQILAPLLLAISEAIDRLLTDHAHDLAEPWKRQLPKDFD